MDNLLLFKSLLMNSSMKFILTLPFSVWMVKDTNTRRLLEMMPIGMKIAPDGVFKICNCGCPGTDFADKKSFFEKYFWFHFALNF